MSNNDRIFLFSEMKSSCLRILGKMKSSEVLTDLDRHGSMSQGNPALLNFCFLKICLYDMSYVKRP